MTELQAAFGINHDWLFFPERYALHPCEGLIFSPFYKSFCPSFNHPCNYDYQGRFPELDSFLSFEHTEEEVTLITNYWQKNHHDGFHFKDLILQYCYQHTLIIAKACLTFLAKTLEVQSGMITHFSGTALGAYLQEANRKGKKAYIHPFSAPYVSAPSYYWGLFKCHGLKHSLFSAASDDGIYAHNVSRFEHSVAVYFEELYSQYTVCHEFASKKQPSFGGFTPDIYVVELRLVIQCHGCRCHYHNSNCPYNKDATLDTVGFRNKTFREGQARDNFIKNLLLRNYSKDISSITTIFQCQFEALQKQLKRTNHKKDLFLPAKRLSLRAALVGGRGDFFALFFLRKCSQEKN